MKFGDAGTKFFHANATVKHRKNLIIALEDDSGVTQSNHHVKASILWEAFKDILGLTEF